MNKYNEYLDYYKNNRKILRKLEKEDEKIFDEQLPYLNNSFISEKGISSAKFNEASVKLFAQSFCNIIAKKQAKILIAHDGSDKEFEAYSKIMNYVFKANKISPYLFSKNASVPYSFIKYSATKIQEFDFIIYLSQYSFNNFSSLSIYNKNCDPIDDELIIKIVNNMLNLSLCNVKEFLDEPSYLNIEKLLNEYSSEIISFNHTKSDNKIITVGIINNNLNKLFIKKIMGKNDFGYKNLKFSLSEDCPLKIHVKLHQLHRLKNINYLIKFSYDFKKIYIYAKKNSFEYSLIDINSLAANYILFVNNVTKTNEKSAKINKILCSIANNIELFECIAKKYDLKFSIALDNQPAEKNSLKINENFEMNFGFLDAKNGDAFLTLSVIADMLNYYETQQFKFKEIELQNLTQIEDSIVSMFSIPCHFNNIESFETKLFSQTFINQMEIKESQDIRNYATNEKERYIAKIIFDSETETLFVKYSYELQAIIFICKEKRKPGNIYLKFKKYFVKFLANYSNPLIPNI
ncbi:MAG5620 family putative phospho-sugar mutase [Metamycoplasma equirhinis]|uniref:MAG5620 family putative phospho-sugar mutase n=2 Tax=Metamycoplasma equirhinis TaxID=92402 RepID=UPI0035930816